MTEKIDWEAKWSAAKQEPFHTEDGVDTVVSRFRTRVDASVARGFYYFVSPSGIFRVQPVAMSGAAYKYDDGIRFDGNIEARSSGHRVGDDEGGFVLRVDRSIPLPRKTPASDALLRRLKSPDRREDVKLAYTLRFAGESYLFVQWKGYTEDQRLFWGFEFSIYKIGPELQELLQNGFACDI